MDPVISSFLDQDLYKFTTMYGYIVNKYDRYPVRWKFINRDRTPFPNGFAERIQEQVEFMADLKMTKEERDWMENSCGKFLPPAFFDLLQGFRYNPSDVGIKQEDEDLSITIEGLSHRVTLWEVPLMAIISEMYSKQEADQYSPKQSEELAYLKGYDLANSNCLFADFGTRRRFSLMNHRIVVEALKRGAGKSFLGSSNCMLAMENDIIPIGTNPHEWYMFHAAKYGVRQSNNISLGRWVDAYNGHLGTALTDTFTSQNFIANFDIFYAKLFDGVRQDSGDPIAFGETIIRHYESLGIDPSTKVIVFSDSLNVEKAIHIKKHFGDRIRVRFGIGTSLTNDAGIKPLNMVVKMNSVSINNKWTPCVKLSDDEGKHTGDSEMVDHYKVVLKYT